MRPRIAKPEPGTRWSQRETARLLNVPVSVIHYQITKGKIIADAAGVDALSAYEWSKTYEPHKDNAARRVKVRNIPQMQAAAAAQARLPSPVGQANGNGNGATQTRPVYRTNGKQQADQLPQLDTREWVNLFMEDRFQRLAAINPLTGVKEMNPGTTEPYWRVFKPFILRFPTVPLDRIQGREEIVKWIHGLKHQKTGAPQADGSKAAARKKIAAFYNWLEDEKSIKGPSLKKTTLPGSPAGEGVVYADESRKLLKTARDHSELTLFILEAQTGARIGEILTIRPECVVHLGGYGWVHTWDKRTSINKTGYRPLCLPSESYEALMKEFAVHGEFMLPRYGHAGNVVGLKALAGPLVAEPGKRIRMDDPKTFRVMQLEDSYGFVQHRLQDRMREAGIYEPGKLTHAFRRAYQSDFVDNGGDKLFMRLIMGHLSKSNMDDLYFRAKINKAAEVANKYAPREFLQRELELASAPLPGLSALAQVTAGMGAAK